ncbi:MAG: CarD family transcriptional regulator [Lachnospiraceae bacterium]|nr:CarD family transcriptional regulator [Lachnospiraceae bacterium]
MFHIDEYVMHVTGGICQVKGISPLEISGADRNRNYYLLVPIRDKSGKVYVPVDNDLCVRKVITRSEADDLIKEIPSIEEIEIDNDKLREVRYKEAIKGCNPKDLIKLLKNLNHRRVNRIREGKKTTATDEKYFKIAEDNLLNELAFALGKEKNEMRSIVLGIIENPV